MPNDMPRQKFWNMPQINFFGCEELKLHNQHIAQRESFFLKKLLSHSFNNYCVVPIGLVRCQFHMYLSITMFFAELHYGLPAELGFADLKTVCMTTRNAMMDPTNKSQDLNGNYSLNVSFLCWEDSQPLQWKKMVVLSSISILTLASNSVILVAILSMKQKVFLSEPNNRNIVLSVGPCSAKDNQAKVWPRLKSLSPWSKRLITIGPSAWTDSWKLKKRLHFEIASIC